MVYFSRDADIRKSDMYVEPYVQTQFVEVMIGMNGNEVLLIRLCFEKGNISLIESTIINYKNIS